MWRVTLMALGLCLCLVGLECMVIDRAVLADQQTDLAAASAYPAAGSYPASYDALAGYASATSGLNRRVFVPPDWAPWGLLSAGAILFLYSSALADGGRDD